MLLDDPCSISLRTHTLINERDRAEAGLLCKRHLPASWGNKNGHDVKQNNNKMDIEIAAQSSPSETEKRERERIYIQFVSKRSAETKNARIHGERNMKHWTPRPHHSHAAEDGVCVAHSSRS